MFKKLFAQQSLIKSETLASECPNCWGKQAYGETYVTGEGHVSHPGKKSARTLGWIQAYFEDRLA